MSLIQAIGKERAIMQPLRETANYIIDTSVSVIRNAKYTALRDWSRKYKREISLEYLTEENHYPLSTADKYFQAPEPDEEYTLTLCGDTVIFSKDVYKRQW